MENQKYVFDAVEHDRKGRAIKELCRRAFVGKQKINQADYSQLILPRSDPQEDPWGAMCDSLAEGFARNQTCFGVMDAGETALFATQLKHVLSGWFGTEYQRNVCRGIFNVDNSIPSGAQTVAYRRLDKHGELKKVSSISDDIPFVTISAAESTVRVVEWQGAIGWSLSQLESAAMAGFPLSTEELSALMFAAELNFESVALSGDTVAGIFGYYNESNLQATTPTTGTWSSATQAQILADCQKLLYEIKAATKDVFVPNILLVPSARWRYLWARSTTTDRTVYSLLQEEFPGLRIESMTRADTLGSGSTPRILAGNTSPLVSRLGEPLRITPGSPQLVGAKYLVVARQKLTGVIMPQPLAWRYMDGC